MKRKCPREKRFSELTAPEQVAVGCLVDTRRGTAGLISARGSAGGTQSADFWGSGDRRYRTRGGARNHLAGGRRCDRSTLFKVTEGVLSVRDDVNRKTMTLREGMRCVAQEAAEVTGATVLEPAASGVTGAVGDKGSSGQFPAFRCGMTHLTPPLYGPAQLPANSGRLQARLGTGARWISHARVDSLLGRMALPAEVKKDAVALVTTYCATKIPAEHDDKIRIEYKVRGNAVTLCQGSER